jgi:hypothetical protein
LDNIYTLNEYINLVKELGTTEYYFRGENHKYPLIASSLLRKNDNILLKNKKFNFYEELVNDYFSEIAADIGELERKNFLAFSQHHGLSTNLIDLTTSPLIALYFACSITNGTNNTNNMGYVYLFEKGLSIDISSLINKYMMAPSYSYNIVNLFLSKETSVLKTLTNYFSSFFWEVDIKPYLQNIINLYLETIPDLIIDEDLYNFVTSLPETMDTFGVTVHKLLQKYESKIGLEYLGVDVLVNLYIILLREYFNGLSSSSFYGLKDKPSFPKLPYLLYKTPYKFDRIRNQDGVFLSQLFHTFATKFEDVPNEIVKQEIIPDKTFIIKDQETILEELDFIGINLKSIYGDFDNIASYLNKKKF